MTELNTSQTEEMKRYLFHEMNEKEQAAIEGRFFADSDYFYDLVTLENDLVDRYARGDLRGADLNRFERSLQTSPERREKVANAKALQRHIAEEKQAVSPLTAVPRVSFWERLSGFFNFQMPAFQYVMAGLLVLMTVGTVWLLIDKWRSNNELARYKQEQNEQNQQNVEIQNKLRQLQIETDQLKANREELQSQIQSKQGESEIKDERIVQLESEIKRKENEIENLQREKRNLPPLPQNKTPEQISPPSPVIAFLVPTAARGGQNSSNAAKIIPIKPNTTKINLTLQIPQESTADTFIVKLNGTPITGSLKPRPGKSGKRLISISLSPKSLGDKEHILTVVGNDEKEDIYKFKLVQK